MCISHVIQRLMESHDKNKQPMWTLLKTLGATFTEVARLQVRPFISLPCNNANHPLSTRHSAPKRWTFFENLGKTLMNGVFLKTSGKLNTNKMNFLGLFSLFRLLLHVLTFFSFFIKYYLLLTKKRGKRDKKKGVWRINLRTMVNALAEKRWSKNICSFLKKN